MTLAQRLAIGAMSVAFVAMLAWTFADAVMPEHWALRGRPHQAGDAIAKTGDGRHVAYRQTGERALTGRVVRIADGDTLMPQSRMRCCSLSTRIVTVTVEVKDHDRYGRLVEGLLALRRVDDGLAWWYRHYAPKAQDYEQSQQEAKAAGRGLWADKEPMPPWDYRREHRRAGAGS